jgi:hypothetical protein
MTARSITLHAFCSAKGGVGKSALSVLRARRQATHEHRCILLDADFTGTSLADGLNLRAPQLRLTSERIPDLQALPAEYLSRLETVTARSRRKASRDGGALVYLNDILTYSGPGDVECHLPSIMWKHERPDNVLYVPSSPLQQDIDVALGWLYKEEPFAWLQRLSWLLDGIATQFSDVSDIVIDLPPGLFGFTHETLVLLSTLSRGLDLPSGFPDLRRNGVIWTGRPTLVVTKDLNDLSISLDYFISTRKELPHLEILLNRYTEGHWEAIISKMSSRFGGLLPSTIEAVLNEIQGRSLGELRSLKNLFVDGDMNERDDAAQIARVFDQRSTFGK